MKLFTLANLILLTVVYLPLQARSSDALPDGYRLSMETSAASSLQHTVDKWSHGHLVRLDRLTDAVKPTFYVFNKEGKLNGSLSLKIPGAGHVSVKDFDVAADSTVVAVGSAESEGRTGYFVARVSPDENQGLLLRTDVFSPHLVAVASDNSIWVAGLGLVFNADGIAVSTKSNADTLRHFDAKGKLLASGFPKTEFSSRHAVAAFLSASSRGVAWYGPTYGDAVYLEIAPDFTILHRYDGAPAKGGGNPFATGFALTDSGAAYVSVTSMDTAPQAYCLYSLDRAASKWIPVTLRTQSALLGNHENSLVFHESGSELSTVVVVPTGK